MIEGKVVYLEKSDIVDPRNPLCRLPQGVYSACAEALVVIVDGRVMKNRLGSIGAIVPELADKAAA